MEQVIKSARVELGAVLKKCADERGLTAREVGNKTRSSAYDVSRWWSGELCPTGEVWGRLIQHQGKLRNYRDLFQRARIEQDAEQAMDRLAARGAPVPPAIVTNLGDKLEVRPQVQVHPINVAHSPPTISPAPEPEPEPDNEMPEPGQPKNGARYAPYPGAYSYEKHHEKRNFARAKLLERPRISLQGRDGLNNLIRDRFGTGMSYEIMLQLQSEVHKELGIDRGDQPVSSKPTAAPQPAAIPAAVVQREPTADDINAAVQLLMQAIPNLQSLTIIVDEHGEADVSYETRKVQIVTESNSIKVRR